MNYLQMKKRIVKCNSISANSVNKVIVVKFLYHKTKCDCTFRDYVSELGWRDVGI